MSAKHHRHGHQPSREDLQRENERLRREVEDLQRKVTEREQQVMSLRCRYPEGMARLRGDSGRP